MGLMRSLSGRLLIVTICVVMLAEVAIFVPSVARFRQDYLLERVHRAEIAAFTVLASPDRSVSAELQETLINRTEVMNVVVRREGVREMVLSGRHLPEITETYDLRESQIWELIRDALIQLTDTKGGIIRVLAYAPQDMGKELEVTMDSAPLAKAIPRQRGIATKNTTILAGISFFK